MKENRAQFATRIGVVAVTVGSAVGLGNIWRFPFEAGSNGGGAFLLVNLLFVFVIGVPVICAEFIIGRHTGANVRTAFRRLAPGEPWGVVGYIGILASVLILSFYSVVAGWTMEYMVRSFTGTLGRPDELHGQFDTFVTSGWRPVMWTLVFLLCNYLILARGVEKGIERMANVMMPALFVLLVVFCVNSLTLDRAGEGLRFLFCPDFSKLTARGVLNAMGQAFFSLSLGLGGLITYSSYFSRRTPLMKTAVLTASLDSLVAVMAGVIIFPAVFSFGQQPAAGPKLVFEALPAIFGAMKGGAVWSVLFFVLLFLASLTSTVSMSEISIAYFTEELHMKRGKATMLNIGTAMALGTVCALSFGCLRHLTIGGMTVFGLFDWLASNILLPVGGMLISFFAGHRLKRSVLDAELLSGAGGVPGKGELLAVRLIVFSLKWVAPASVFVVFLFGLGVLG